MFETKRELLIHQNSIHLENLQPWPFEEFEDRPKDILKQHQRAIRAPKKTVGTNRTDYNYVTDDMKQGPNELASVLRDIYSDQETTFKINFGIGMILKNVETEQYKYFAPFENNKIFESARMISSSSYLNSVTKEIMNLNLHEYIRNQKPSSKWRPVYITNAVFWIYPTKYPLGAGGLELPDYVKHHRVIIGMNQNPYNKHTIYGIKDRLCIFRCLAYHQKEQSIDKYALQKQHEYRNFSQNKGEKGYLELNNIESFETCLFMNYKKIKA